MSEPVGADEMLDRIEELEQAEADSIMLIGRIEELEGKLAKAVGALEGLMMHEPDYADTLWRDARTALAELKGQ